MEAFPRVSYSPLRWVSKMWDTYELIDQNGSLREYNVLIDDFGVIVTMHPVDRAPTLSMVTSRFEQETLEDYDG